MGAAELKAKLAVDDKELELMREHTVCVFLCARHRSRLTRAAQVLTVEHAKVKKMLLADKDHELQEYEYQWGVAKANMAASEVSARALVARHALSLACFLRES